MIMIFKYIHAMSFSEAVKAKVKYEGNNNYRTSSNRTYDPI